MSAPKCPVCGASAIVTRTSRELTNCTREIYGACQVCGVQLKGLTEWTSRLTEGLIPETEHQTRLPLSPSAERQQALDYYRTQRGRRPTQSDLFDSQ